MKAYTQAYDQLFFSAMNTDAGKSADIIVPLIIDLLNPRSVIDIGCGTGTWLAVFRSHCIEDITGVDGSWVQDRMLSIPKSSFLVRDLTQSINIERRYDLAVSLEVAEHLDSIYSKSFVNTLVQLSPVVVFSAAIPFQGGTQHVSEHWPDYWANLFSEHGYVTIDCIRERIWNNDDVAWWYAQNILVFAEKDQLTTNSKLQQAFERTRPSQLGLVHPKRYLLDATRPTHALRVLMRRTTATVIYRLKRMLNLKLTTLC
jgi:hypothetical protein